MNTSRPKRFWTTATAVKAAGGFEVQLDERRIKTPGKAPLCVPTLALAEAIAKEWDAQIDTVDPSTMPLTRLANSAIDKVSRQKAAVADLLAAYGDSDLLCYRAEAPESLVSRQMEAWDPYLSWASEKLGAQLEIRHGVVHVPQDPEAIGALNQKVHEMNSFQLTAFHDLVSLTGSLILAFATTYRFRGHFEIWEASRIDEKWQSEQWGEDEQEQSVAEQKYNSFCAACSFFELQSE